MGLVAFKSSSSREYLKGFLHYLSIAASWSQDQEVSEYDQEILRSKTPDQPTTSWGRVTEHLQKQDIRKTIKAKLLVLSSSSRWLQN